MVSPFESPESSVEKDAKLFIQEENDLGETIELPKEEAPARPLLVFINLSLVLVVTYCIPISLSITCTRLSSLMIVLQMLVGTT